jgi:hypothetical protein
MPKNGHKKEKGDQHMVKKSPQQMQIVSQPPLPAQPARRYTTSEVFSEPTDIDKAWGERRNMIRAILNAGVMTLRDRAMGYILAQEKETFMRNAHDKKPQPNIVLEDLLNVFEG